jgi:hypothetical protein
MLLSVLGVSLLLAITTYNANEEGTGITLNLVDGPAIDGVSVSLAVK